MIKNIFFKAAKTLKKSVEDSLRTGPIVKNQNDATGAQFFLKYLCSFFLV